MSWLRSLFPTRPAWLAACGLLGLGCTGCTGALAPPQYLAYLADPAHGLTQTQEQRGTTVTCSYRPADLLVSQELADAVATPTLLDSLRRTYAGKFYCTLALARDSAELEQGVIRDALALEQTISYLSSGIAHDVYLHGLGQPDSVAALAASYARQYGNTRRSTVMLAFDAPRLDTRRGFSISYHDTQLGLGTMRFVFTPRNVQALPALRF